MVPASHPTHRHVATGVAVRVLREVQDDLTRRWYVLYENDRGDARCLMREMFDVAYRMIQEKTS